MFWLKKISIYLKGWLQTLENFIWLKKPEYEDHNIFDSKDQHFYYKNLKFVLNTDSIDLSTSLNYYLFVFDTNQIGWILFEFSSKELDQKKDINCFGQRFCIQKLSDSKVFLSVEESFEKTL